MVGCCSQESHDTLGFANMAGCMVSIDISYAWWTERSEREEGGREREIRREGGVGIPNASKVR